MAKPQTSDTNKPETATATGTAAASPAAAPANPAPGIGNAGIPKTALELELEALGLGDMSLDFGGDALMYNAKDCGYASVIGYPYFVEEMQAGGRDFFSCFVRLYAPSKGYKGKGSDRKIYDVKAGCDLVVPLGQKLRDEIIQYTLHPEKVFLVAFKFKPEDQKIDTKGGFKMWDVEFKKFPLDNKKAMALRIDLALPPGGAESAKAIAEKLGESGDSKAFFEEIEKNKVGAGATA